MQRTAVLVASLVAVGCPRGPGSGAGSPEDPGLASQEEPMPKPPPDSDRSGPLAEAAVAGVEDPRLRSLLAGHWDWLMRQAPVWATTLGDRRFDRELERRAHADVLAARAQGRAFLDEARALAGAAAELSESDRLTLELFTEELEASVGSDVCDFHLWSVSAISNLASRFNRLPDDHAITSLEDAENLLARYRQIPDRIDAGVANLRLGREKGLTPVAESVRRAIAMIDRQLDTPRAEWALLRPAREVSARDDFSEEERSRFAAELEEIVTSSIEPAIRRYRAALAEETLPGARGPDAVGVGALASGAACYRARIRDYTGLDVSAEELHGLGRAEIARINREMQALGKKLFRTPRLDQIVRRLRTDRRLYFKERGEIVEAAERALAAAKEKMSEYFGILPAADCVVVEIPDYEAPFTTIAYYRQPHAGGKPGEYFINTYKPEVRPRFEMEVLAYHEAIPGHHLQIAIGMERGELPAFRRYGGNTAFVEGWALYSERLADEMGLYGGDLDRMGMLSYEAWRAARLVVDTGIHSMGWTRERAEKYMREHTALAEENIRNEVDRYIAWPGQALAYKVGQLEILRLRREAEERLGDRFDIRAFHDAVLENGAVTLPVLRRRIEAFIAARE